MRYLRLLLVQLRISATLGMQYRWTSAIVARGRLRLIWWAATMPDPPKGDRRRPLVTIPGPLVTIGGARS
jgi:hypothetical protein